MERQNYLEDSIGKYLQYLYDFEVKINRLIQRSDQCVSSDKTRGTCLYSQHLGSRGGKISMRSVYIVSFQVSWNTRRPCLKKQRRLNELVS